MAQSCLKCLKYTICVFNFLFFVCGTAIFGCGLYLMLHSNVASILPSLPSLSLANCLFIIGIIITCVSFLGFLGALKENRCLLITFFILLFLLMLAELAGACVLLVYEKDIDNLLQEDLNKSLQESMKSQMIKDNITTIHDWDIIQRTFNCCGVHNASDWKNLVPSSCCKSGACTIQPSDLRSEGCYYKLKRWFEENFLSTGVGVIMLCIIEVLGMCFSMTLFCHISRSGLGYKL